MIKAILAFIVLLFSSFLHAYNDLPDNIRATQVKEGCGIKFLRDEYPEESNGLSYPLYDVLMKWDCASGESALIDRYDIEGISPEIVTVLFWRKRSIAVLVKWAVNSHAADFQGDFYRVYVYRYEPSKSGAGFKKEEGVMKKFGKGWDGELKEVPVHYRYKDAASIRKRLGEINYLK